MTHFADPNMRLFSTYLSVVRTLPRDSPDLFTLGVYKIGPSDETTADKLRPGNFNRGHELLLPAEA